MSAAPVPPGSTSELPYEPLPEVEPDLGARTLAHVLHRAARMHPDTLAVAVDSTDVATYADLRSRAMSFAAVLEAQAPEARHVGVLLPNGVDFVVALYGAALARRTAVLLNPRLRDPELVYQIGQSQVDLLVSGEVPQRPLTSLFEALAAANVTPDVLWTGQGTPPAGRSLSESLAAAPPEPLDQTPPGEHDIAAIIYTSGSTALPKGVMLSHQTVVRNAELVGERLGATERDRVFSAGPFFHSGGLSMQLVMSALAGATAFSVTTFDPTTVLDLVDQEQITLYSGIETLFLRLPEARGFTRERLRSIRSGWTTGTPAIVRAIAEDVGVPGVVCVYGITEAGPNVTMSEWDDTPEHRFETIGRPQAGTEVRLVDPETGAAVETGVPGEIVIRSYGLMAGYWGKPAETAAALSDGWLHTGDLGVRRDDGYLVFAGRIKDIVRVSGENVSCAEVENALYSLGGVELAAVIPVEDQRRGQMVVAAVKLADPAAFDEAGLIERLRKLLAGYKVPKRIVLLDQLPLTESGKVQKGQLTEIVLPILDRR